MRTLFNRKSVLTSIVMLLVFVGAFLFFSKPTEAARGAAPSPTIVVLTASWCGSCGEITPIVKKAAGNIHVVTLDVDSNSAPADAGTYGISVAGDVPQVYLYNKGK